MGVNLNLGSLHVQNVNYPNVFFWVEFEAHENFMLKNRRKKHKVLHSSCYYFKVYF